MSLSTQVSNLATRIGTEIKAVYGKIGNLANLTTTEKSSLVGAINEIKTTAGAQINDTTPSLTTVYSSSKTDTLLGAKLDSSAYTAADVLVKVLTVDGAGSGLDADLLDGNSSAYFATAASLANYVPTSSKGAANGVATLDANSLIPAGQLPSIAISDTYVVATQAAMLALTAQRGDVAIRTDLSKSFILATDSPSTLADWKELLAPADAVASVDGRTGTVTLSDLYASVTNVGDTTTNFVTVFEAALV